MIVLPSEISIPGLGIPSQGNINKKSINMAKKLGPVARYGPRYGRKLKRVVKDIEVIQRQKHTCPFCERNTIKRLAAGIWSCKKCKTKFAGGAYTPTSAVGEETMKLAERKGYKKILAEENLRSLEEPKKTFRRITQAGIRHYIHPNAFALLEKIDRADADGERTEPVMVERPSAPGPQSPRVPEQLKTGDGALLDFNHLRVKSFLSEPKSKALRKALVSNTEDGRDYVLRYYPNNADEELIELMAKAGCVEVALGSESGSAHMLRRLNKKFTPQEVRRISDRLKNCGINRMGFLMLGGPGETRSTVEESLAFADSLALEALKITRGVRIYPNTALARTAVREGMISPDDDLLFPTYYMVKEIENWLRETVDRMIVDRPNWVN